MLVSDTKEAFQLTCPDTGDITISSLPAFQVDRRPERQERGPRRRRARSSAAAGIFDSLSPFILLLVSFTFTSPTFLSFESSQVTNNKPELCLSIKKSFMSFDSNVEAPLPKDLYLAPRKNIECGNSERTLRPSRVESQNDLSWVG